MNGLKNPFGKFLFFLGDTNIFIAFAAASCCLATYSFHSFPPDYNLVVFIFFATLFTYNLQRRVGELDSKTSHRRAKTILMALAVVGMLLFCFTLSFIELVGLGLAGVLSIGYAVPCIPFRGKWWSIRGIPYMKIWIIVAAWIAGTSLVPLIDIVNLYSFDDRISTLLFLVQQGAFILALTVPFDVRDLKVDFQYFRTLPMVLGTDRAIKFAQNAVVFAFIAAFLNYLIGFFGFPEMLVQFVISFLAYFLIRRGRIVRGPLYYSIDLDGMIILQGVAVFVIEILDS